MTAPVIPQITCARCFGAVRSSEVWRDFAKGTLTFIARCHDQMDTCTVKERDLLECTVVEAVAFKPRKENHR